MGRFSTLLLVAVFSTLVVGAFASGQSAVLPQAPVAAAGQTVYTGMVGLIFGSPPSAFDLMLPGQHGHATLTVDVNSDTVYWAGGQLGSVDDLLGGSRVVVQLTGVPADGKGTAAVVEIVPTPGQGQF